MRVNPVAVTLVASMVAMQSASARDIDITSQPFMRAALTVMTFDYFAAKCEQRGGFKPDDAGKIAVWEKTNGVAQIRARLSDFERHPTEKRQLEQALAIITNKVEEQSNSIDTCQAALSLSGLPEAQFAKISPEILAPVSNPPQNRQETVKPPASRNAIAPSGVNSQTVAQIHSFGFNTRPKIGIGGFVALDIYPIVLFRNGEVLTDVEGLSFNGGLTAHKRANPKDWTRWRNQGGKLQIATKDGWENLPFQTTYGKLPDNFKLDGLFRSLSGTGTVAIGGSQSVAVWQDYRFSPDGRVVRGRGAGGQSEFGDSSVVTSNIVPNQRGRYRIQGLTLNITYDDGSQERRILITDPKDPKSAIWLDGISYVRRKQ
ncbi:hypothetical protein CLI64_18330 [Nostoc sp. CENA543]|uniref:hypothetical protein n=1 Tax=Nostoc sp. CENA543 TaxID=1869241 RepID=UPI000CA129A0|nr:hypothetical protein [Nostoc sp. CENA543]AUT02185.1 hypothetical protein CLI64_18330 [Nostoc sp. CENA543]